MVVAFGPSKVITPTIAGMTGALVALGADGRWALSGGMDSRLLQLWDLFSGCCVRTFEGHTADFISVALSKDSCWALSGSDSRNSNYRDYTLRLWDVRTGRCERTFDGHAGGVTSVVLSADHRYALSGSSDNTVKLWELSSGRCLRTFEGHARNVSSLCLSVDGRFCVSGSYDKTVKLWEVSSGRCLRTFEAHADIVNSVCLSPDSRYALSGSHDTTVKLWELSSGRCLRTFEGHAEGVTSVCLSADGRLCVSSSYDNTVKLWEICGNRSATAAHYELAAVTSAEAAATSLDELKERLHLANAAMNRADWTEVAKAVRSARAIRGYRRHRATLDAWMALYRYLPKRAYTDAWIVRRHTGHKNFYHQPVLNVNGQYCVLDRDGETIKLFELFSGHCLRTLEGHTGHVSCVSLSTDLRYCVSTSCDKTVKVWDVLSGQCLQTFEGDLGDRRAVALTADRRFFLSDCGNVANFNDFTLKLWEFSSGRCLRTFRGHTEIVSSVCLSPDGRYVLSGSGDSTVKLWELSSGLCLRTFEGHEISVTTVCLGADGRYALSGSRDKTLKLWDLSSGRCVRTLSGHTHTTYPRFLTADSRYALSDSDDKSVRLWELSSGRCLRSFGGHADPVAGAFMSLDGRHCLLHANETVQLWELDWELEDKQSADWDEGARPYIEVFLTQQMPYAIGLPDDRQPTEEEITLALTRRGGPTWTEDDFKRLLDTLGCAGFGWLRSEGVRRELEKMAADWQGPRSLVAPSNATDDVSREDHPLPASDDLFLSETGENSAPPLGDNEELQDGQQNDPFNVEHVANRPSETEQAELPAKVTDDSTPQLWAPGDVIADLYEVRGVIGQGGFGRVYRVHHRGWNTDLAVKQPLRLDPARQEIFTRECETWLSLNTVQWSNRASTFNRLAAGCLCTLCRVVGVVLSHVDK